MKLFEYQVKKIMREFGILVPRGEVFFDLEQAKNHLEKVGEGVIKAQVLTGGRGKAGGVKIFSNPAEGFELAEAILKMTIKGEKVQAILIEEKIPIEEELYLSIFVDGRIKKPVVIASKAGGVDIEEVPEEEILKLPVDPLIGVRNYHGNLVAQKLGLTGDLGKQLATLLINLYRIFETYQAELVEINPLVISREKLIAADGKMTVDDDARFRWPADLPFNEEKTPLEKRAEEIGVSFVELDGNIAVMANGAGITMATLDLIAYFGGKPKNFMDAGGGANAEQMAKALDLLISTNPKAILINIFGGITRCDEVAKAYLTVKQQREITVPVVIRLVGTNEDIGVKMLQEAGVESFSSLREAVIKAVELAKVGGDN
ncbi:ADP-forming succinate--CoA ligase subunit beta [Carboxydothermus ferrireducens]|uniref:Succinate--CoA ligase [ADP-forming] subunit beta n=1 Tax=Carboxydothermus ferrireducens DSM 11255 TaxID=1119529 RepID=A0ABX2RAD0_9THEO|nr:ADP-forming succinate--CoA ligase subunit beta [Carboxydothermus ferrireducens]NYE56817.1 succinyl-CoA synthetase beta subunit [Carboxydothermus ferrireducens DSM 11255]